jgi:hypothetical protein
MAPSGASPFKGEKMNLGYKLQAAAHISTASATLLVNVGAAESFHLQRLLVSVSSITDGAYLHICYATATASLSLHSVSASVTNIGFLDFGENGYAGGVGEDLYYYMSAAARCQVTAIGYKIG